MSNFYYLDVSLVFPKCEDIEVTAVYFKKSVVDAVNQLFGETATCVDIDVLKYNKKEKRAILRVPQSHYVKLRSSLSFAQKHGNEQCYYVIHKASSLLLSLQANSRLYNF